MLDFSSPHRTKVVITASTRRSVMHYCALNIVELSYRWFVRFEDEYRIQSQNVKTFQNSDHLVNDDSAAGSSNLLNDFCSAKPEKVWVML